MSSKVTAKLPLGAAFSVLLISLALLAGCKQEAPVDSYAPPGYGASVGSFTDTVWKSGSDTIRFGAEGKVVDVPSSWKKDLLVRIPTSNNGAPEVQADFNDFTYSGTAIYGKVTKASSSYLNKGDIVKIATFTVPTKSSPEEQGTPVTNYYEMKVTIAGATTSTTFYMENKPNSEDKFVGTYYDGRGRKKIQINKDGTFVTFANGGQSIQYWKYQNDGTIYVKNTQFGNSSNEFSGGSTYYLYPHALMSYDEYENNSFAVAWK